MNFCTKSSSPSTFSISHAVIQSKSANEEVHGPYDLNKTPITPIGPKGLVYNDPAVCDSWVPHRTNAFYVGPTPKHYWCLQFYMPATR